MDQGKMFLFIGTLMAIVQGESQRARKFKKVQARKLVKSNKSISRIFFDQIPFFAISKMAKNQFLNWGKSLKVPEM